MGFYSSLTNEQRLYMYMRKESSVGDIVMFPGGSFISVYKAPHEFEGNIHIPLGSTPDKPLIIKEKVDNFYRVNWYGGKKVDWWMKDTDLFFRGAFETFLMFTFVGTYYVSMNKMRTK